MRTVARQTKYNMGDVQLNMGRKKIDDFKAEVFNDGGSPSVLLTKDTPGVMYKLRLFGKEEIHTLQHLLDFIKRQLKMEEKLNGN